MKKKIISAILITALVTSAASCGGAASGSPATAAGEPSNGFAKGDRDGITEAAPSLGRDDAAEGYYGGESEMPAATTTAPSYDDSYDAGDYSYDESFDSIESFDADFMRTDEKDHISKQIQAGLLTGGEWRDNSNFIFWQKLFEQRLDWQDASDAWQISTLDRVFVRVKDANGTPAAGMKVLLSGNKTILWEAVTDSRGEAFLYQSLCKSEANGVKADEIIVEAADGRAVKTEIPDDYSPSDVAIEIAVPDSSPMRSDLDLMLMVDTTGSMSDELKYLQTELENVINRVVDNTQAKVRLSVNFYRDTTDDYIVRDFGFTDLISIALDHLKDQRASGGGDYPEAVTTALDNALNKHDWNQNSEKIMLLVLDAPPHEQDGVSYLKPLLTQAAKLGVRIIPVASSGVDTDTEFLCRCMAMATGGTYTFLTDDSGIGNSHLEPTIGKYEVEKLNDMLVRIITEYFTQEPRKSTQQYVPSDPVTQHNYDDEYPAEYFFTHDYFDGEGMYTTGIITSEKEYYDFQDKYGGYDLDADNIDLNDTVIAYKVDMLSSGSITVDDSKGVYCTVKDGKPVFRYELDIPEVGTADIVTLFVYAFIPAELLNN